MRFFMWPAIVVCAVVLMLCLPKASAITHGGSSSSSKQKTICIVEGSTQTFSCGKQTIKFGYASYRQKSKTSCKAKDITWDMCGSVSSCTISSNNGYTGDPCPNHQKELCVFYNCVNS